MKSYLVALVIGLTLGSSAYADECRVDPKQKNVIKFLSDAPIEDFEGVTDKVDGYVKWDADGLEKALEIEKIAEKSEFYFEVDLDGLDTGIGLRNRHMRENYLETDKKPEYRYTHFQGKITKIERKPQPGTEATASTNEYLLLTEGKFFVHGVEQDYKIPVTVTALADNIYKIHVEFEVPISKFDIKVPSIMFYKIDENMQLTLDFFVKKVTDTKPADTKEEPKN